MEATYKDRSGPDILRIALILFRMSLVLQSGADPGGVRWGAAALPLKKISTFSGSATAFSL